jgi:hypothetical protein
MRWTLGVAAACALVVATGGCGSQITVPDQGIIVSGCQMPSACFRADCDCSRGSVTAKVDSVGACTVSCTFVTPGDPSTCDCLPLTNDGGDSIATQCIESVQACVGRGVFCGGVGALCKAATSPACDGTGDPPMLIPTIGMPMLEPHCQYSDDVCCPGTDGGVPMTD